MGLDSDASVCIRTLVCWYGVLVAWLVGLKHRPKP